MATSLKEQIGEFLREAYPQGYAYRLGDTLTVVSGALRGDVVKVEDVFGKDGHNMYCCRIPGGGIINLRQDQLDILLRDQAHTVVDEGIVNWRLGDKVSFNLGGAKYQLYPKEEYDPNKWHHGVVSKLPGNHHTQKGAVYVTFGEPIYNRDNAKVLGGWVNDDPQFLIPIDRDNVHTVVDESICPYAKGDPIKIDLARDHYVSQRVSALGIQDAVFILDRGSAGYGIKLVNRPEAVTYGNTGGLLYVEPESVMPVRQSSHGVVDETIYSGMIDESLTIRMEQHLCESSLATVPLMEFLNYNQLVAATKDHWAKRFDTVKQVQSAPPDLVILRDGDMDLSFDAVCRSPGSGRKHRCNMTFYPDNTTKKATVARLKEWWGSLRARLNKFLGRKVPEKILNGGDLRQMKVKVSCDCEDYLYRFEVANKSKGASDIKHSNGARPNIRNPDMNPGLCKHLLSELRYLSDDSTIQAKETPKK